MNGRLFMRKRRDPGRTQTRSTAPAGTSRSIVLLLLTLIALSNYTLPAQTRNPCAPSIKLDKPEQGYGPPNVPIADVSLRYYERAKKELLNPKEFYDLYCIGYMAYELNKYQEAIYYFSEAEKLIKDKVPDCPCCAHFYTFVAFTYEDMGNLDKAKEYYLKGGDPYYVHLINAKTARKQGDLAKAENEYLLAQSVSLYEISNISPFWEIAKMYFEKGQRLKSKSYIIRFLECARFARQSGDYVSTDICPQDEADAEAMQRKIDILIKNKG